MLQRLLHLLLLCISLPASFIHLSDASVLPGASGLIPPAVYGSAAEGHWRWNFIDVSDSLGTRHAFKYGVGDRDRRDKEGERGVPAIRYAHSAVTTASEMIITHGSAQAWLSTRMHA